MKLLVFFVCSLCSLVLFHQLEATNYQLDLSQSLAAIKIMIASGLSSLHVRINSLFESSSGQFPVDDTPLLMNYFAHDCDIHLGRKRMIFDRITFCKADVTEVVTKTSRSCVKPNQMEAVQCATKLILEKIQLDIENNKTTY